MSDRYRVVGPNHRHNGKEVEPGTVLSADEIPDGILRNFPNKFEPVEGEGDANTDESMANVAGADNGTVDTESAADESEDVSDDVEVAETDDPTEAPDEVPSKDEEVGPTSEELTRERLVNMTRSERVDLAKDADHIPEIDGRSSDEDIISALAVDADDNE